MKGILLCAGKGERLLPLTKTTPKSLVDLGDGETLLSRQVREMRASGVVHELVLVVGYLAAQIERAALENSDQDLAVRCVFNPFFDVSNNLLSLWMARHEMQEDFFVSNGDNLFDAGAYRALVEAHEDREGIFLTVIPRRDFEDEDMKVIRRGGAVRRVSKDIEPGEGDAESPGLSLVRGEAARQRYVGVLEELARLPEYRHRFWLEAYNQLEQRGSPAKAWELPEGCRWQEVDFHLDVDRARELLRERAFL